MGIAARKGQFYFFGFVNISITQKAHSFTETAHFPHPSPVARGKNNTTSSHKLIT